MAAITITATDDNGNLKLTGNDISNDTITFSAGTTTVTITQGAKVTLNSTLSLPTSFSNGTITLNPGSQDLSTNDPEYVFTCKNNLTKGAASVTGNFTVTATIKGVQKTAWDPTMLFKPPDDQL